MTIKYMFTKDGEGNYHHVIPTIDGWYWLIRDGELATIVRVYINPDTLERGVGFNLCDGGGFLPMSDLCEYSFFAGPIEPAEHHI